ncbi:SsgA family sporulation/cell division regulator [Streptomyces sp. EMB26]
MPVDLAFHYSAADPYAVRMEVHTGVTPRVAWAFVRDLLMEGLSRQTGLADVQVWPASRRRRLLGARERAVRIRISSQAGRPSSPRRAPPTQVPGHDLPRGRARHREQFIGTRRRHRRLAARGTAGDRADAKDTP